MRRRPKAGDVWPRSSSSEAWSAKAAAPGRSRKAFAAEHPGLVAAQGRISASADAKVYSAQARAASCYDYSAALAAVEHPVLVMQGLADRMTSPGGSVLLSRALPHGELRLIEGVGHNLHTEMGDRFVATVLDFLARHEPS